jgi:hypothetical protein
MPHLSQLQQKYGNDIMFVGVTREPEETVKQFLGQEQAPGKTWADVVQYRLAVDAADATNTAYMSAAQQSGIPTAFIVGRDALIEWIGHPMTIDDPLEKVAAGTWDRKAAEKSQGNPEIDATLKKYETEKANQSGGANLPDGNAKQ